MHSIVFHPCSRKVKPHVVRREDLDLVEYHTCVTDSESWQVALREKASTREEGMRALAEKATNGTPNNNTQPL